MANSATIVVKRLNPINKKQMLELPQENNRNNKLKTFSIEALEPPNIDHTGLFLFGRKQHCEVTVRCSPLTEDFLIPIP